MSSILRKLLQKLLTGPVIRLSNKFGSRPNKERIFKALTNLYANILKEPGKKGPLIQFSIADKFIILSDQHKGARNYADDFAGAEQNYLAALKWYNDKLFTYINLGDSEDLWENLMIDIKKHNKATFEAERLFLDRGAFLKIFGNHDLYWDNDPLAAFNLKAIYKKEVKIFEGAVLQTMAGGKQLNIFLTHGHQGDMQSDGNWFSKWFVSTVWAPFQSLLRINPNTPAYDNELKSIHNQLMYSWSVDQRDTLLITGHTHQPVFKSLTHLERLYLQLEIAISAKDEKQVNELKTALADRINKGETAPVFKAYKPSYFNSGCCCFSDGDITGIELENGAIRLIKWEYCGSEHLPTRIVLEEITLDELVIPLPDLGLRT